jgi:hypothetical protein
MGGLSAITGFAGYISSLFEKGDKEKSQVQKPAPAATGGTQSSGEFYTPEEFERYKELIGFAESRGDYGINNTLGYLGKYQFGVAALETLGLIKEGATKKLGGEKNQSKIFDDPSNWNRGLNKQIFLADTKLQDETFERMTAMNYKTMRDMGLITAKSTKEEVAGLLTGAHLGGPGGVQKLIKEGVNRADANGTTVAGYIKYGTEAFMRGQGQFAQSMIDSKAIGKQGALSAASVSSSDAESATLLAEVTNMVNDLTKQMAGGGVFVDQSNKSTNVSSSSSGGGSSGPARTDNHIKDAVNQLAYGN